MWRKRRRGWKRNCEDNARIVCKSFFIFLTCKGSPWEVVAFVMWEIEEILYMTLGMCEYGWKLYKRTCMFHQWKKKQPLEEFGVRLHQVPTYLPTYLVIISKPSIQFSQTKKTIPFCSNNNCGITFCVISHVLM